MKDNTRLVYGANTPMNSLAGKLFAALNNTPAPTAPKPVATAPPPNRKPNKLVEQVQRNRHKIFVSMKANRRSPLASTYGVVAAVAKQRRTPDELNRECREIAAKVNRVSGTIKGMIAKRNTKSPALNRNITKLESLVADAYRLRQSCKVSGVMDTDRFFYADQALDHIWNLLAAGQDNEV